MDKKIAIAIGVGILIVILILGSLAISNFTGNAVKGMNIEEVKAEIINVQNEIDYLEDGQNSSNG